MKILDEKGKLFGKINVIDLLILVVIFAVLIGIGVMILGGDRVGGDGHGNNPDSSENSGIPVPAKLTYIVRVTAQHEEMAEWLKQYVDPAQGKKAQLQHGGELVQDAYVVDFWAEPCRYNVISNGEVEVIGATEADAAGLVNLCFVVEAVVGDSVTNEVEGQEVRVGKSNIVKTQHFEFANGFVVDCEWETIEK